PAYLYSDTQNARAVAQLRGVRLGAHLCAHGLSAAHELFAGAFVLAARDTARDFCARNALGLAARIFFDAPFWTRGRVAFVRRVVGHVESRDVGLGSSSVEYRRRRARTIVTVEFGRCGIARFARRIRDALETPGANSMP